MKLTKKVHWPIGQSHSKYFKISTNMHSNESLVESECKTIRPTNLDVREVYPSTHFGNC